MRTTNCPTCPRAIVDRYTSMQPELPQDTMSMSWVLIMKSKYWVSVSIRTQFGLDIRLNWQSHWLDGVLASLSSDQFIVRTHLSKIQTVITSFYHIPILLRTSFHRVQDSNRSISHQVLDSTNNQFGLDIGLNWWSHWLYRMSARFLWFQFTLKRHTPCPDIGSSYRSLPHVSLIENQFSPCT